VIVLVPLFIVALFLLFAVYAVTDLDELMREQVLLDELWLDDGGVTERGSTRDIQPATDPQASGHIERREDKSGARVPLRDFSGRGAGWPLRQPAITWYSRESGCARVRHPLIKASRPSKNTPGR